MTLRVVPEGLAATSAAVEALTARLAAAHAAAAPAITAVIPPAVDPVSLQTALGFSAQGQEHAAGKNDRGYGQYRSPEFHNYLLAQDGEAQPLRRRPHRLHRLGPGLLVAHDPALAHVAPPHLELRLHQQHEVGVRRGARHQGGQHQRERDKGEVGHHEPGHRGHVLQGPHVPGPPMRAWMAPLSVARS